MTPNLELAEQRSVDLTDLLSRLEGDHKLLCELVEIFADRAPQLLSQLKAEAKSGLFTELQQHAYTMQGMLATLSCMDARTSATRLERLAARGDRDGSLGELDLLERELSTAYAVLQKACVEIFA